MSKLRALNVDARLNIADRPAASIAIDYRSKKSLARATNLEEHACSKVIITNRHYIQSPIDVPAYVLSLEKQCSFRAMGQVMAFYTNASRDRTSSPNVSG